jgi:hypothetical protein
VSPVVVLLLVNRLEPFRDAQSQPLLALDAAYGGLSAILFDLVDLGRGGVEVMEAEYVADLRPPGVAFFIAVRGGEK